MSKIKIREPETITHEEWVSGFITPLVIDRPPNGMTIEEVMKATNRKRTTVVRLLNERIDSGELKRQLVCIGGRNSWVYFPAKNKK